MKLPIRKIQSTREGARKRHSSRKERGKQGQKERETERQNRGEDTEKEEEEMNKGRRKGRTREGMKEPQGPGTRKEPPTTGKETDTDKATKNCCSQGYYTAKDSA